MSTQVASTSSAKDVAPMTESEAAKISGVRKITPWEKKMEQRKKQEAIKQREKEMKQEKVDEADRKRQITKERQHKAAEKARLEIMASKMSAKKLQRKKRRMGITKKVSHSK